MRKSKKALLTITSTGLFLGMILLAHGQTATCQTTWPECSGDIEAMDDVQCDPPNAATWEISDIQDMVMFACNNWWNGCGGSPGSNVCNVQVKYVGKGRLITCESGASFYCMTEINAVYNLKRDCAGNFCDVPNGLNESPFGDPPAGEDFLEGWEILPSPPSIPNQ